MAFSSGVGYVLQILVLGWAIAWVRQAGSNSWVYGLIPVVPLLAPFWVIVREQ